MTKSGPNNYSFVSFQTYFSIPPKITTLRPKSDPENAQNRPNRIRKTLKIGQIRIRKTPLRALNPLCTFHPLCTFPSLKRLCMKVNNNHKVLKFIKQLPSSERWGGIKIYTLFPSSESSQVLPCWIFERSYYLDKIFIQLSQVGLIKVMSSYFQAQFQQWLFWPKSDFTFFQTTSSSQQACYLISIS